ncbi:MAG: lysylphosphatidylglycerol synthase domain-containing protein [Flavobacteriaceae bacterium]
MIAVHHKAKQYLLATAKVLVLAVTFGYIFFKLKNNDSLGFIEFTSGIFSKGSIAIYSLLFFGFLATANWYFEILKWQSLVSTFEQISFKTALKQSLASLTVSLATPNRIGEYGAKAFFFENRKRKKILLLNFFSGAAQMLVTTFFGVFGLLYLLRNFNIPYSVTMLCYVGIGAILLLAVGFYFKEKELFLKGFSIAKTIQFFQSIPFQIKFKAVLFSVFRYVTFSGMFYGLLLFFGGNINFPETIPLIFAMYFLVSILPTLFIFDVVIRGGVAVWLFSFAGVPELTVLSTVLAMWLLNFVMPSLLGSFFVLTYQPTTK